jgi:hypothetical protein
MLMEKDKVVHVQGMWGSGCIDHMLMEKGKVVPVQGMWACGGVVV